MVFQGTDDEQGSVVQLLKRRDIVVSVDSQALSLLPTSTGLGRWMAGCAVTL